MSGPDRIEQPTVNSLGPRSMVFRKRRNSPQPTPEQSRRQSDLIQSAWRHFRDATPMIAFLNTRHPILEGQPLQLAIESDDGLQRVEQLLKELTLEA